MKAETFNWLREENACTVRLLPRNIQDAWVYPTAGIILKKPSLLRRRGKRVSIVFNACPPNIIHNIIIYINIIIIYILYYIICINIIIHWSWRHPSWVTDLPKCFGKFQMKPHSKKETSAMHHSCFSFSGRRGRWGNSRLLLKKTWMRAEQKVGTDLIRLERRKKPTREIRLVYEKCVVLPGERKFASLRFVRKKIGKGKLE